MQAMNWANNFGLSLLALILSILLTTPAYGDADSCKFISADCPKFNSLDFQTIPYITNRVLSEFTSISNLFDQKTMKQCLKDRYLVYLGDSTISERILDMAMTMGGISKNETALDNYIGSEEVGVQWINSPHHDPRDTSINSSSYYYFDDIVLAYHAWNHRNMTITAARDRMKIRYRFTGHYQIHNRFLGISTLLHPSIEHELGYMLGYDELAGAVKSYTRIPNGIIIHSGYHDLWNKEFSIDQFIKILKSFAIQSLFKYIDGKVASIPTIYWQSSPLHSSRYTSVQKLQLIENEVFKLSEVLQNLVYINTTKVYEYIPDLEQNEDLYTNDFIHFGAVNRHHFRKKLGTISVLMTNYVLTYVCATENYVDNAILPGVLFPMPSNLTAKVPVSIAVIREYQDRWLSFVGSITVEQSGETVCLVTGRTFPCPSAEDMKWFSAMKHETKVQISREVLRLFYPIDDMPKLTNNSLIRASNERQIYWIQNGIKIPITHGRVFFNRGWEFDNVIPVNRECIDLFQTGDPIDK